MIKKKLISHISFLTLILYSLQVVILPQSAQAETLCWNDGSIAYSKGGTLAEKPPMEDKGQPKDADPVNLSNGNYHYGHEDISIPARGFSFTLTRTYNSQDDYDGPFGYGWNHNYNIFLVEVSDGIDDYVIRRTGDGKIDKFLDNKDGTYTSPDGVYDVLSKEGTTYVITDKHGTRYEFNGNKRLQRIVDRNNNEMSFAYNAQGQLETVTDTTDRQITLSYNANKKLSSVTDFAGRITSYSYTDGNLTSVTTPPTPEYPQGLTTIYTYDANNNLASITDAKGQTYISLTYDEFDRVANQRYGEGTFNFSYDAENKITRITDREGYQTVWTFNDNGTPLTKKETTYGFRGSDPAFYQTLYIYNDDKELTEIAYPNGNSTKYTYDNNGNILEIRRISNQGEPDIITAFTYEGRYNFVKTITDPQGNVTTYTYDYELPPAHPDYGENGNLIKITYPSINGQTLFTYNSYGQVETITDPNGNITKYEYYPATGYLKKITTGFGVLNYITEMTYDNVGNVTAITDAWGNTTTFEYNALNQLTKTVSAPPFNYETKYYYDENGNLKEVDRQTADPLNPWQTTAYTYDILDKLKTITDDLGNTTTFQYDLNENRSSITDAEGNTTTYQYDERDLLWKVTDALGNITEYAYDGNANLKEIMDARLNKTTYAYDGFDRLITTTYEDGTTESYTYDASSNLKTKTNQKGQVIAYDYDELNRLTLKTYPDSSTVQYQYDVGSRLTDVTDGTGTIHYDYDQVNRIKEVNYTLNAIRYTLKYEYDALGNRTKLTYPDSSYITYTYDQLNRLTNIKDQTNNTIASYSYDALSRRTQLNYANNTQTTYSYDEINRLLAISSQLSAVSYTYDNVGNRLSMTQDAGPTTQYAYDDIYQLTNVTYPDTTSTTYNYDELGNRTSTVNGGITDYFSNEMNQYDSVGGAAYTYDANGNLTNDGTQIYTYDSENRLTRVQPAPPHTSLRGSEATEAISTYDAFGRRITKNVDGTITNFIYDGDQIIMETDASHATTAKYISGPGIDEPILMERGGERYYYNFDGLGSVVALSDSSGSTVETYTYDVYGLPNTTSGVGNPYLFTGREYDTGTRLYYYRARYYDPGVGRFLQRDPVGYWGGINLYSYVGNNPIIFIDPLGLKLYKISGGSWSASIYYGLGGGTGIYEITDVGTGESMMYSVINVGLGIGASVEISKDRYFESDIKSVTDFAGRSWELDFAPLAYKQGYNTKYGEIENYTGIGGINIGVELSGNWVYFWPRIYKPDYKRPPDKKELPPKEEKPPKNK